MSGIAIVVIVFFVLAAGLGIAAYIVYQGKLRRAKSIERALKMVPLLIHLPPPSSDTEAGGRDIREVMREKTAQAEVLYNLIAGTATAGFKSSFYGQRHMALELIASEGMVHFYTAVPINLVDVVKQAVLTAYPGARLEEAEDHNIFNQDGRLSATVGGELLLKSDSAYPIATYAQLERDPLEALLTTLGGLNKADGAAIQIMLRPANPGWVHASTKLTSRLRRGRQQSVAFGVKDLAKAAVKAPTAAVPGDLPKGATNPNLSQLELGVIEEIEDKTKHPGFEILIRVLISTDQPARSQQVLQSVATSFALYDRPGHNGFKFLPAVDVQGLVTAFIFRFFPPELHGSILNSKELATLFHLPDAQFTPTTNVERQQSKQVDGPSGLPNEGLLFGHNEFRGVSKEIRLSQVDRRRHTYVLGQTGTGKSTMLENLIVQDMLAGNGFAFIDPHGESAEKLLAMVPKNRAEDVIYFNPADMDYPLGLNLFEYDTPDQKDFLVQESLSMLIKLYDPNGTGVIGPRFEQWYRNAALTLMADPNGSTFIEIPKVFTDTEYLKQKFKYLKDPTVIDFWTKEMGQTSDYHKSEMLGYFVSKFGAFQQNEMMRNIIGQTKSAFNLREIMDNKKILIVNLSKGRVGELNSKLLGMMFVIKFQAAAMSRANLSEDQRSDFCLYVDEFQNFSTDSFASILSEARKYRLNLIVANQFIAQLTPEIRDAVFGNIGTIVAHRMGPDDAEFMVKQFSPVFDAADLMNIPNFHSAMRLMIGGLPSQPFTMANLPALGAANLELGLAIKQLSAAKFGLAKEVVEADIEARLAGRVAPSTPQPSPEPVAAAAQPPAPPPPPPEQPIAPPPAPALQPAPAPQPAPVASEPALAPVVEMPPAVAAPEPPTTAHEQLPQAAAAAVPGNLPPIGAPPVDLPPLPASPISEPPPVSVHMAELAPVMEAPAPIIAADPVDEAPAPERVAMGQPVVPAPPDPAPAPVVSVPQPAASATGQPPIGAPPVSPPPIGAPPVDLAPATPGTLSISDITGGNRQPVPQPAPPPPDPRPVYDPAKDPMAGVELLGSPDQQLSGEVDDSAWVKPTAPPSYDPAADPNSNVSLLGGEADTASLVVPMATAATASDVASPTDVTEDMSPESLIHFIDPQLERVLDRPLDEAEPVPLAAQPAQLPEAMPANVAAPVAPPPIGAPPIDLNPPPTQVASVPSIEQSLPDVATAPSAIPVTEALPIPAAAPVALAPIGAPPVELPPAAPTPTQPVPPQPASSPVPVPQPAPVVEMPPPVATPVPAPPAPVAAQPEPVPVPEPAPIPVVAPEPSTPVAETPPPPVIALAVPVVAEPPVQLAPETAPPAVPDVPKEETPAPQPAPTQAAPPVAAAAPTKATAPVPTPAEVVAKTEDTIDDLLSTSLIKTDATRQRLPEVVAESAAAPTETAAPGASAEAGGRHWVGAAQPGATVNEEQVALPEAAESFASAHQKVIAPPPSDKSAARDVAALLDAAAAELASPSTSLPTGDASADTPPAAVVVLPESMASSPAVELPTLPETTVPLPMPAPAPARIEDEVELPPAESLAMVDHPKPQPAPTPETVPTSVAAKPRRRMSRRDKPEGEGSPQVSNPVAGKLILPSAPKSSGPVVPAPVAAPPKHLAKGEVYVDPSGKVVIGE